MHAQHPSTANRHLLNDIVLSRIVNLFAITIPKINDPLLRRVVAECRLTFPLIQHNNAIRCFTQIDRCVAGTVCMITVVPVFVKRGDDRAGGDSYVDRAIAALV